MGVFSVLEYSCWLGTGVIRARGSDDINERRGSLTPTMTPNNASYIQLALATSLDPRVPVNVNGLECESAWKTH